jgi:hypothetical protein
MKFSILPTVATTATSLFVSAAAFAAAPLSDAAAESDSLAVLWKGQATSLAAVEAEVGAELYSGVANQLDRYRGWIAENEYHVALADDLRVVLVTESEKSSKDRLELVNDTLATFDVVLTPPDRSESTETYRGGEWGVREHAPDAEPVVLIELKKGVHYQTLLSALEESDPDMSSWASVQSAEPGFAEERFMATGWQAAPDGYEIGPVWRSENELVNRLTRLLLYRSYGPQPNWLTQAAGWAVEQDVVGNIYCFPYRSEFIGVGEHEGWYNEVKGEFKSRKKKPLELSEFIEWKRGTWDADAAAMSWAFTQFLIQEKPGVLPALAESNRLAYRAGFTIDLGDGQWKTNPSFAVSPEAQFSTLQAEAGEDVLDEATKFFRTWKRGRTTKASSKRKKSSKRRGR